MKPNKGKSQHQVSNGHSIKELTNTQNHEWAVLNALPVHVALLDKEGVILEINESWKIFVEENFPASSMFRVGSNLLGDGDKMLKAGFSTAKILADGVKAVLSGAKDKFSHEYEFESKGEKKWLRSDALPVSEIVEDGIVLVHVDVTDRKRSQQVFFELYKRYELISRATNDCIWDWNILTDELYWNENYYKQFGYDERDEEASIEKTIERIHPEDRERVVESFKKVLSDSNLNGYWECEYRFFKKDGSIAYVFDRAYVVYDKRGIAARMVGAMQNITERKLAEIERERITNDLIQHNKELQQFSYIVSHNLRAPVANIIGCLDVLENIPLDASSKKQFNDALITSVKKLDSVIQDLNAILQVRTDINQGKEEVVFSRLVEDIETSISNLIAKEGAVIYCFFDEVNVLYTVKSYLHSIFYNLIVNGIKYKKPKQPAIIEIISKRADGVISITFKDNGIGIDLNNKKDKIFGLYKRFNESIEGKGMGLFMVKNQVESLGGKVSITSEIDKGTEVTITFPIK